ncbi:hypothetical protein [Paenibacillus sp. NPDC101420]|uniref:hypothetical protein n=1 Tax=Paenibacillus sp. NPDC101420 TaxID=3390602 RepID=UPI003CFEDE34
MKGFENLITKYSYSYPEIRMCRHCRWGGCVDLPCTRQVTVEKGIYFGYNYPDNLPANEQLIINTCAATASAALYGEIMASIALGPAGIAAAIATANTVLNTSFKECINQNDSLNSDRKEYIIKVTKIGFYQKDESYFWSPNWIILYQNYANTALST